MRQAERSVCPHVLSQELPLVPRKIVFVCSGNTCRSPLAAALAQHILRDYGLHAITVTSAGLHAVPGAPAAPEAAAVARGWGLSLEEHRAQRVEDVEVDADTLLLAMTPEQAEALRSRVPTGTIQTLIPLARQLGAVLPGDDRVADPAGAGPEAYQQTAERLAAALRALAAAWAAAQAADAPEAAPRPPLSPWVTKSIALPRLAGLRPTLESTALKLLEEAGELAEAIGKFRALSGEPQGAGILPPRSVLAVIGQELLDVAQTAVTMMFVLEEQYGLSLETLLQRHVGKLAAKGYLDPPGHEVRGGGPDGGGGSGS